MVTVAAPGVISDLPRYRENQRRLVYDSGVESLAAQQKAVVLHVQHSFHRNKF